MTPEIAEVQDFLGAHHPFDLLPQDARAAAARAIEIAYVRKGAAVLAPGAPLAHLHIVRTGAVESRAADGRLLGRAAEGECFALADLLRGGVAGSRTAAIEDCLVYLLPAETFTALRREHPAFGGAFAAFNGGGLAAAIEAAPEHKSFDLLSRSVGDLLTRGPVTVPRGASIREAAAAMQAERVSSALIVEGGELVGILTDRDLRGKVVAAGRSGEEPVESVMSPQPLCVQASDPSFAALLLMSRRGIHHLPVLDKGRLVGCLSSSVLAEAQTLSPLAITRAVHAAADATELPPLVRRVPQVAAQMAEAGATAHSVGQVVTAVTDAVTRALLRLAEAELGPPPAPYAWLAAGSQGRQEQTAVSDQDNCLLLDDRFDAAEHGGYFAALSRFVVDGLAACGYAYCPGEMMAVTPRWRQPLAAWRTYFERWILEPEPRALMLSCIFFDLRCVGGEAALWETLSRDVLEQSRKNRIFLAHMAANAMHHAPPIGFFRGFVLVSDGAHDNTLDLKHSGAVPIVDMARVHALSAGIAAANTQERLLAAAEAGEISRQGAMDLKDALEFIGLARLKHQARQIRDGAPPDNFLDPKTLSGFERGNLKSAFQVVKEMQASMASAYQLSRF
ncbi:MAG: DUF294 nucleotidyltransferase-like domain-containing protein [Rhodospirillaceae bacterium]